MLRAEGLASSAPVFHTLRASHPDRASPVFSATRRIETPNRTTPRDGGDGGVCSRRRNAIARWEIQGVCTMNHLGQKTLCIPELLLEGVLRYLGPLDWLKCAAVCPWWSTAILGRDRGRGDDRGDDFPSASTPTGETDAFKAVNSAAVTHADEAVRSATETASGEPVGSATEPDASKAVKSGAESGVGKGVGSATERGADKALESTTETDADNKVGFATESEADKAVESVTEEGADETVVFATETPSDEAVGSGGIERRQGREVRHGI